MNIKSTSSIRRTLRNILPGSTPNEAQMVRLEEIHDDSRIPAKYRIVQSFSSYPYEYQNKGYQILSHDDEWLVVLWPNRTSNPQDEIRYLKKASEIMLDDISKNPCSTELETLAKQAEAVEICLSELARQMRRDNSERADLMENLLSKFSLLFNQIPDVYNNVIDSQKAEFTKEIQKISEENDKLRKSESLAIEELKSQKVLLQMQKKWHENIDEKVSVWKTSLQSFSERLKNELRSQKIQYEDRISELQSQLDAVTSEKDAYKAQMDWEQKEITKKEAEVIDIRNQLKATKAMLDEREQTLYTTRAHFERQFMFMKEQMNKPSQTSQNLRSFNMASGNDQMVAQSDGNNPVSRSPTKSNPEADFLSLYDVNRRILDIYRAKVVHDATYPYGAEPPLSQFVIKFHLNTTLNYEPALLSSNQFLSNCDRYKHSSPNVGIFVQQIESQTNLLKLIQHMAVLVKNDSLNENGLPILSLTRCIELSQKVLDSESVSKMKHMCEKKVPNPKRGMFIDFGTFLSLLLDLTVDTLHSKRERILFQFKELRDVDWPLFRDFVWRFSPEFTTCKVADLFMEGMRASHPTMTMTPPAFQLLIDNGVFEDYSGFGGDEIEVANSEEMSQFVNSRWNNDYLSRVTRVLEELRNEDLAECQVLFSNIYRIKKFMDVPVRRDDAGVGLSMLHLAGLYVSRYKFLKIVRKDTEEAKKELRRVIELFWPIY